MILENASPLKDKKFRIKIKKIIVGAYHIYKDSKSKDKINRYSKTYLLTRIQI